MRFNQPAATFWDTDPRHFWWLIEGEAEKAAPGRLTAAERRELIDMLEEAQANG